MGHNDQLGYWPLVIVSGRRSTNDDSLRPISYMLHLSDMGLVYVIGVQITNNPIRSQYVIPLTDLRMHLYPLGFISKTISHFPTIYYLSHLV